MFEQRSHYVHQKAIRNTGTMCVNLLSFIADSFIFCVMCFLEVQSLLFYAFYKYIVTIVKVLSNVLT